MFRNSWCLIGLLMSAMAQEPDVRNAVVTGTLTGDDGSIILGGHVSLRFMRTPVPARRPSRERDDFEARTESGGVFRFDNLRAGSYQLCVQVPKSVWLGSCDWGGSPIVVTLSPGAARAIPITMRKGALIPVRLDDPAGVVARDHGKAPGAHLMIGIGTNDALFRPAIRVAGDSGGQTYQVLIPFDPPAKLVFSSDYFQLADERGMPMQARTAQIPISVPARSTPATVRFIATGKRSP